MSKPEDHDHSSSNCFVRHRQSPREQTRLAFVLKRVGTVHADQVNQQGSPGWTHGDPDCSPWMTGGWKISQEPRGWNDNPSRQTGDQSDMTWTFLSEAGDRVRLRFTGPRLTGYGGVLREDASRDPRSLCVVWNSVYWRLGDNHLVSSEPCIPTRVQR